ncbi:MAG: CoA-binding protein [Niveispirillum sp.]|uniref:CoA-binding protein n=1 Tax=Niveispirillum sp. TaxID=1917217 RepID=UPI003BA7658E
MNHDHYSDDLIRHVLDSAKTIAVVGATADPAKPSFYVMKYLADRGHKIIPVNPALSGQTVLGQTAYACLADLPERPDMVDIFRRPDAAGEVAVDAAVRGIPFIWMQLGIRNDAAAAQAEALGSTVIMDRCPMIEVPRLYR